MINEHIASPHYPRKIWIFQYRGVKVELTVTAVSNECVYSAWVDYDLGSAVAVPSACTQSAAIAQAKQWVDSHFNHMSSSLL